MSGHSRPSGGPSQRLDTRRSQIRGIADEPQNCRLKVRIIEPQTETPTERKLERERLTENQGRGFSCRETEKPGDGNSRDGPKDRNRDAQNHRETQSTENPVHTHSQRETETGRDKKTETERK